MGSPHSILHRDLKECDYTQADPGASGVIRPDRQLAFFPLVSAGAEARTVPDPLKVGMILFLYMKTDGGDITVTFSTAFTESGQTTHVFANVGEHLAVVAVESGSSLVWRPLGAVGGVAALTAAKPTFTIADAEGTPDNAIAAVTSTTPFGFSNAAELITLLYKVQNIHTRLGELEAALQKAGILR